MGRLPRRGDGHSWFRRDSIYSLPSLARQRPCAGWRQLRAVSIDYEDAGPLRPRHLCSAPIPAGGDAISGRVPLMGNSDVVSTRGAPQSSRWTISTSSPTVTMCLFIHDGTGVLESQFGSLRYRPGDYLVIPTGVIWRLVPDEGVAQRMLVIESYRPRHPAQTLHQQLRPVPGKFALLRARYSAAGRTHHPRRARGV